VWAFGLGQTDRQIDRQTDRQTDTQTRVTTIHFASSATYAKCNKYASALILQVRALKLRISENNTMRNENAMCKYFTCGQKPDGQTDDLVIQHSVKSKQELSSS